MSAPGLAGKYPFRGEDIARLEEADFVRWEIPDLNGISKGKIMSASALAANKMEGISLYGGVLAFGANSDIVVVPEVGDSGHTDCFAVPRAAEEGISGTGALPLVAPVPWAGSGKHKVVSVLCDTKWKHGGEDNWQAANPRVLARKQLQELSELGFKLKSACEYEYRVLDRKNLEPITSGTDIFNTLATAEHEESLMEIEVNMRQMGVNIETLQMEYGSSQFELTLEPQQGLDAADAAFRFKHGVKEMYQQKGLLATFMTKPLPEETANSCHFNHCLLPVVDRTDAVFKYSSDDGILNDYARYWLGGLLKHAPALTALFAPTVNCYRRLHGPWAPSHGNWGVENRFTMVRVKQDEGESCYFENRLGCGASNPYLIIAATVAAGLDGLRNKIKLPAPDTTEGCTELPKTLPEALDALEADACMVEGLGSGFVDWFRLIKEAEMKSVEVEGGDDLQKIAQERKVYSKFL